MKAECTPLSDLRLAIEAGKERGIIFKEMRMLDVKFKQLIQSTEFISAFNEAYPLGADMTIIRVNKVMKLNGLLKIKIYPL